MPITKIITLYYYHELSHSAKERARQWWYEATDLSDYDSVIEDAAQVAADLGITLGRDEYQTVRGTCSKPDIRWSGFSSQGDGASFSGVFEYPEWNIVSRIEQAYPQDLVLHAYARVLHEQFNKHPFKAMCKCSSSGGSYVHSGWMDVSLEALSKDGEELDEDAISDEDTKIIRDTLRGFADWIYAQLEEEDTYLHSDEHVSEVMQANQYTFEENGNRRD